MSDIDTIAALASAPGRSEIGIIRTSGPGAVDFMQSCFVPADEQRPTGRFHFYDGHISGIDNTTPIACRVLVMRGPHSYTREDVVEFQLPGSPVLLELFLQYCYSRGLRRAGPGEFTRRAFTNGRISLTEAIGVMEIISAEGREQLEAARSMLLGGTAAALKVISDMLQELIARVELSIDFSEENIDIFASRSDFTDELDRILEAVDRLIASRPAPAGLAGESHVIITGMVNAGKSTLFNRLLGAARCRVSEAPGTTRDLVKAELEIEGAPFVLYDSPGFSSAPDLFEQKARAIMDADAMAGMLMILAVSPDIEIPDHLLGLFLKHPGPAHTIVAATKTDLGQPNPNLHRPSLRDCSAMMEIGTDNPDGMEQLISSLLSLRNATAGQGAFQAETLLLDAMRRCTDILLRLREDGDIHTQSEIVAEELRAAAAAAGELNADAPDDAVLNRIFSAFCIGK